jgi:hypothetical protein
MPHAFRSSEPSVPSENKNLTDGEDTDYLGVLKVLSSPERFQGQKLCIIQIKFRSTFNLNLYINYI